MTALDCEVHDKGRLQDPDVQPDADGETLQVKKVRRCDFQVDDEAGKV